MASSCCSWPIWVLRASINCSLYAFVSFRFIACKSYLVWTSLLLWNSFSLAVRIFYSSCSINFRNFRNWPFFNFSVSSNFSETFLRRLCNDTTVAEYFLSSSVVSRFVSFLKASCFSFSSIIVCFNNLFSSTSLSQGDYSLLLYCLLESSYCLDLPTDCSLVSREFARVPIVLF